MEQRLLVVVLAITAIGCSSLADDTTNAILESQFLTREELQSENDQIHEAENKVWYKIGKDFDEAKIKREWVRIQSAIEMDFEDGNLEQQFANVNLSFPFLFFGGTVHQLTVTSAGALLTGASSDVTIPSHIAPFLTKIPPSVHDRVLFYDKGSYFLAQWTKHIDNDDHHIIKFRVKLYPDGTIRFFYKNFLKETKSVVEKTGSPAILGLQDGFSAPKEKGSDIYIYPGVSLTMDELIDRPWAMITLIPEPGCFSKTESTCTGECKKCGENDCVYNMELHRPNSVCYSKDTCPKVCPLSFQPVCGSDGVTYSNLCQLNHTACEQEKSITVAKNGTCDSGPQRQVDYCKVKCPEMVDPVCGSDDKTYANKCILWKQNCLNNQNLTIQKNTACGDISYDYSEAIDHPKPETDDEYDDDVTLNKKSTATKQRSQSTPSPTQDDCKAECDENAEPVVCLNGHIQFSNECAMKKNACVNGITVEHFTEGFCSGEATTEATPSEELCDSNRGCPDTDDPVCGSNGITYQNECILKRINCEQKIGLTVAKPGKCLDDSESKKEGCTAVCTRELNPMCGTDGVTYNNKCLLNYSICTSNNTIKLLHEGSCQKFEFPSNAIPSEAEQSIEESKLENTEKSSGGMSTGSLITVLFLMTFIGAIGATFLYRRRVRQRLSSVSSSTRVSTDSWLYPEPHEYRDDEVQEARTREISNSRNWSAINGQPPKVDKVHLVPNMEEEQGSTSSFN